MCWTIHRFWSFCGFQLVWFKHILLTIGLQEKFLYYNLLVQVLLLPTYPQRPQRDNQAVNCQNLYALHDQSVIDDIRCLCYLHNKILV